MKFLDLEGLSYFTTKMLSKIPTKLSQLTNDLGYKKVNSSTTNGNILIDDVETKVYTLPNSTTSTLGGVKIGTNVSVSNGTISVANGSTSAKGVVQLTDSTTSTSTTTAATANSVNSALLEAKQYSDGLVDEFGNEYVTGLSVNGTTITYTKGDGSTGTITTQDTNTVYTHPTTSGNKHIPSGGSSGQILRWASDGTATWGADNNTTYTLSSFGVTATAAELNALDGITATVTELNYVDGVTSNIQTQLNGKAASSHTHDSLNVKGTNTITTTTNDTVSNWGAHKNSIHWYSTAGQLTDQPSQYGYLINVGQGSEVHQLWLAQASGDIKHRGGNNSGWSGTWRTVLDSTNCNTYCAPKYTYGTSAMTPGTSALTTGTLYFQYE